MSGFARPKKPSYSKAMDSADEVTAPSAMPEAAHTEHASEHAGSDPSPAAHSGTAHGHGSQPTSRPGSSHQRSASHRFYKASKDPERIAELELEIQELKDSHLELQQVSEKSIAGLEGEKLKAEEALRYSEKANREVKEDLATSQKSNEDQAEMLQLCHKRIEELEQQVRQEKEVKEQQTQQIDSLQREVDQRKADAEKLSVAILSCVGFEFDKTSTGDFRILSAKAATDIWGNAIRRIIDENVADKNKDIAELTARLEETEDGRVLLQYVLKKSVTLMKQAGVDFHPLFRNHESLRDMAKELGLFDADPNGDGGKSSKSKRRRQRKRALKMGAEGEDADSEGPQSLEEQLADAETDQDSEPQTIVQDKPAPTLAISAIKTTIEVEPSHKAAPTFKEAACQASISDHSGDDEVVTFGTSPPRAGDSPSFGNEGDLFPDLTIVPSAAPPAAAIPSAATNAVTIVALPPAPESHTANKGGSRLTSPAILSILLKIVLFAAAIYFAVGGYQAKQERDLWRDANEPARVLLVEQMGWVHHTVNPFLREKFMGMDAWGGAYQVEY